MNTNKRTNYIFLPDGYNGHTVKLFVEPLEIEGDLVKLGCAEPGREYLIRWTTQDEIAAAQAALEETLTRAVTVS